MHLTRAPTHVQELENGQPIVIFADDLDLGEIDWESKSASDITIITRILRLSNAARFFLLRLKGGPGARVVVITRELVVGEDGLLDIFTSGDPGGSVNFIYDHVVYTSGHKPIRDTARYDYYRHEVNADAKGQSFIDRVWGQDDLERGHGSAESTTPGEHEVSLDNTGTALHGSLALESDGFKINQPAYVEPSPGQIVVTKDLAEAQRYAPPTTLSSWTVRALEHIATAIEATKLNPDMPTAISYFQRASEVSKLGFPIANSDSSRYDAVINQITTLKNQLVPILFKDSITVQVEAGAPIALTRFVQRGSLDDRLAPTTALVVPRFVNSHRVLGFVRQIPTKQDEVQLSFDVHLILDSRLRSLASNQLAVSGQSVIGTFVDWTLVSAQLVAQGISDYSISMVGDTLQVTLDLSQDVGTLALWRLWTEEGLPLTLQYVCNEDPAVKGDFQIPLSLERRVGNNLTISDGRVASNEITPVVLEYFLLNDKVIPLNPAIVIPGRGARSVGLPIPPGTQESTPAIQLPPEAILYSAQDPFSLDEFDTSLSNGLLQKVQIQNLLESYSNHLKLPLMYAEITVHYTTGDGTSEAERTAGPYRLSPRGADGSTITVPFIRPNIGKFSFFLTGTACYDRDCRSSVAIKTNPVSDVTVYIVEQDLLNPSG
jgi:hypothetical protein